MVARLPAAGRFPRAEGRTDGRVHGFPFFLPFSVARGHISLSLDASDDFGRKRILEVTRARERASDALLPPSVGAAALTHPSILGYHQGRNLHSWNSLVCLLRP